MDTTINDTLRKCFSVLACDPQSNIFYLDPKHLGFGAVCRPLCGGDQATFDKLNGLLNLSFPTGTLLQFSFFASPDLCEPLEGFAALRSGTRDALMRDLAEERATFLEACTRTPVDSVSGIKIHDCQLIISVRLPFAGKEPTDEVLRATDELRQSFMQTLASIGFAAAPLTPQRYLRFMQVAINTQPDALWREETTASWDRETLLCTQIMDAHSKIDVTKTGLELAGGKRVSLLTVKRWPGDTFFGRAARYLGDIKGAARGVRENMIITMNVYYPDNESSRSKLETDRMWTARQAEGRIARFMPQYGWRNEDLSEMFRATENGDRVVKAYLSLAVYSDNAQEEVAAVANVRAYYRELGFHLMPDHYMVLPLFLQTLPLAGDEGLVSPIQKYRTMATRHVAALAPVMGAWRGTGTPLMTLYSRDGQLMTVSPFDSNSNYNTIVAAQSGMGKSVLVASMIECMLATGSRVWAIDVGNSYKNLCEIVGGYYLRFTPESNVCLNPFPLVRSWEEEADMIAGIVALMASPQGGLHNYQMQGLKRVLAEQYQKHGSQLTVDLVAEALMEDPDPQHRLKDIGQQLFSFTSKGEYGRYFNGPNTFDVNNRFIVCELEELKGRKHLQRVVLMQLMYQIGQQMYLGTRAQRKLLVVDEAWDLLATDETKDFIVASYRRARKYNGATVTITQSVSDYWSNAGAIAIVENSANMYLLGQKPESIALAKKEKRMPFGDWGYELLESVHTIKGKYSETMFVTEYGTGVGRLVLSEFQNLLFSTAPDDVAAVQALTRTGMPVQDAIHELLHRRNGTPKPPRRAQRAAA